MKLNINIFKKAFLDILKIRVVETSISEEFIKNKILSFLHLSIGQEACAVGVAMGSKKEDNFFGNHRSHAHYLAKQGNLSKMIFEIFGDERGCCNGIGGSMHMLDKKVNFLGSIPILGSSAPIASGIAMADNLLRKNNITIVFVGDGSAEEGSFYETVNMAGLYRIPLLIVIEDNKYAVESSHKLRKVNGYNYKKIFAGLQSDYICANGQDFKEVYFNTLKLRKKILEQKKVGILHLKCSRFAKHSGPEISTKDQKANYRGGEFKDITALDPLNIIKKDLIKMGFDKEILNKIEHESTLKFKNQFYRIFNKINIRKI